MGRRNPKGVSSDWVSQDEGSRGSVDRVTRGKYACNAYSVPCGSYGRSVYLYVRGHVCGWVCGYVRPRRDMGDIEGNGVDVRGDRDSEAIAEFAILPTALIRREIRSSMVKQLASSPDHVKPSTPSSFSFFPGRECILFLLLPPPFISLRSRLRALFAPFPWTEETRGDAQPRRGTLRSTNTSFSSEGSYRPGLEKSFLGLGRRRLDPSCG